MADKRISQLIERVDIANNDVLPIVASGATTTNKVTISTIQDWMQSNLDVGVTSVGLTMPSAFQVSGSPITTSGNINVTATGTASQYIRGDGSLADFPQGVGGGGASVSYYLNGSVSQGTIGGIAYLEMNKTPILGAGTDFTISSDGYIASFITDAGDPALLQIPAGNWNFETYLQASSGGGTPTFYIELYKVDSGGTATLIASNSGTPELIAFGTTINPYFSALAVPQTTLALTDRLAIRYYVTHSGRTITLHTENNTLCQIITTFTTGLTALNGLTAQVQNFATGTSGTNFGITSSGSIHTFNLPDASASARGVVTTGSQIFGGVKTFADGLSLPSAGGTNQASRFVNIGTIHQGSGGSNQIGFNNSNNIYFGKGLDNGGVIQWSNSAVRYYTLPNADGTLALTSDLGNYVPYTGATSNVDLGSNSLSSRNLTANGGLNTGALLLKNANNASLIDTGYFKLCPNSNNTEISFGFSTGASTWKQFNLSSTFITNNTVTTFYLPNGGGTLALTSQIPSNPVGGTGTTNQIPKFSGTSTLTNSNILDNGTEVNVQSRLFVTSGGQQFVFTPNLGTTSNRIETTGSLPLEIVSGGNITFAAGGATPQITLASSGAVTFANKITINTPSDGIGILLNGRTSDNFSSIRFGANTGGGQYNSINVSSSSFDIISIGNTPITFGTNTTGGGGTRMTIGGDGSITLAGALNGTSASFTGSVTSTGFRSNTENGYVLRNNANSLNLGGLTRRSFWAGGTSLDTQIFAETGYGIFLNPGGSSSIGLTLASTGAATFSSKVNLTEGIQITSFESNLHTINGTLSYYSPTNAVYLNGAGASGWLRLNAAGTENDRNSINIFGSTASSPNSISFRTNNNTALTIGSSGAATFSSSVTTGGAVNLESNESYVNLFSTSTVGMNARARFRAVGAGGGSGFGGDFRLDTRAQNNVWNENAFVVDSGGAVGIGTPTPSTRFQVVNDTNNSATFSSRWTASGFWSQLEVRNYSSNLNNQNDPQFRIMHNFSDGVNNGYVGFHRGSGLDGGFLSLGANGTEQVRVTHDRFIRLASGTEGIQFNGDTAAANALDDYEEGTWTPELSAAGGSGSPTYSNRLGWYTKIGRQVTITWFISFQRNTMSGGTFVMLGFPFTLFNGGGLFYPQGTVLLDNLASVTNNITLQGANGTTQGDFIGGNGGTGTHVGLPISTLGGSTMQLRGTLTYFTS